MTRKWQAARAVLAVALALGAGSAHAALDPETKCEVRQLKAAGQLCHAAFRCFSRITQTLDQDVFDRCVGKAANKHAKAYGHALDAAAGAGKTCALSDPATDVQGRVFDDVASLHEDILEGFDLFDTDDRKLRSKLEKLAATQCKAAFAAERRDRAKPDATKLAAARVRAMDRARTGAAKALDLAKKKGVVYAGTSGPRIADRVDHLAYAHDFSNVWASHATTAADEVHVLERIGYGPDDWTLGRIQTLGILGYISEQLDPDLPENPDLAAMLASYPSLEQTMNELRVSYPLDGPDAGVPITELSQAKIVRATASHRQLEAVLTDFWFNHFNVFAFAQNRFWDTTAYERDTIRPNVLGRFPELVRATARAPAMLTYLDNWLNGFGGTINENYARELMELHTLGVDGGYTQADVIEVAKTLSGWTLSASNPFGLFTTGSGFEFDAVLHDTSAKLILGTLEIPAGGGIEEGEATIDFLAAHPSAARFISEKLARRFVSDDPPADLVTSAANAFEATGGDLRATLERILISDAFLLDPANRRSKVKRPHHVLVGAMRAANADPTLSALENVFVSAATGEGLYQEPPPTGYPEKSAVWAAEGALISRLNFLEAAIGLLIQGFDLDFDIADPPADFVAQLEPQLFPAGLSPTTRDEVIAFGDALVDDGIDDLTRAVQLFTLMLSSPDFLLH